MVEWYFYLEKGKAKGPLKKEDVLKAFKQGKLGPLDLIYKKGSEKWTPAFEVNEFGSLFKDTPKKDFVETSKRAWIVLQKKGANEGRGFRQSGPFSLQEVKDKIQSGQLSYQDYAWKSGFKKWTKIKDISEFNEGEIAPTRLNPIHPDEHLIDELKSEKFQTLSKEHIFEPTPIKDKPDEAVTHDLTRPWVSDVEINIIENEELPPPVQAKKRQTKKSATPQITIEVKEVEGSEASTQETSQQWVWRFAIFGLSVLAVAVIFIVLSRPLFNKTGASAPTEPPQVTAPARVKQVERPIVENTEKPKPSPSVVEDLGPRRAPKRISAKMVRGRLEIYTDGSAHFPIQIRFYGQAGKVTSVGGVFKEATVRFTPSQSPVLDLENLSLPKGDYVLELRQEEISKIQSVRIEGRSDLTLSEAKKRQAPQFNRDRRDLALVALDLSKLAQELERSFVRYQKDRNQWALFYRDWLTSKRRVESKVNLRSSVADKALPWSWVKMQESAANLSLRAQGYDEFIKTGKALDSKTKGVDLSREILTHRDEILALRLF